MRKIILGVAITLDGFIEGPNGEYDWCFMDQDYGMAAFLNSIDAIFYGRKSYELMLKADKDGNPFAKFKSYVFSNTITGSSNEYEVISGDIVEKINILKEKPGKDIWLFGGAELTTALMNHKLVDELWLAVHPILLGKGKLLFTGLDNRTALKLLDSTSYNTGLVSLRYSILN
jgi:dihydrofolate reductase